MSRLLFVSLFAASVGVTGCQNAKFSGAKSTPTTSAAPAAPGIPGTPVRPLPPAPPAGIPNDDYGGTIRQPGIPPVVYIPPTPRPLPPAPVPVTPQPIPVPIPNPTPVPPAPPVPPVTYPQPTPPPQVPPPAPPPIPDVPPTPPAPPVPPVTYPQPTPQPQVPALPTTPVPPIDWNNPVPPVAPPPAPAVPGIPPSLQNPPVNWNPPVAPPPPIPQAPGYQPGTVDWNDPMPLPQKPVPCNDPKGCGTQIVAPVPPPPAEDCRENTKCEPPAPVKGTCAADLRVDKKRTKLDVLFVVDTSASLRKGGTGTLEDGELVQIGRGMRHFVKNLDPATDYRIGVMLAHGPATPYHGRLFSAGDSDPAVIDYKSFSREGMSREQIENALGRMMEKKMRAVPNESGGAQGEALLLSLYNSIRDPKRLARIKQQGLFRDEAALAVIFVTDEQDVCFDYSTASAEIQANRAKKIKKGKKGVEEKIDDPYEVAFFNNVCSKAVNGRPLTPGHVYDALMSLKQDKTKLMVNGIGYVQPIPESLKNRVEDENEQAHGILELFQIAGNGQFAELANVYLRNTQFAAELDQLGKYAHFKMKYNHIFTCRAVTGDNRPVHPDAINFTSMQARVMNSKGQLVGTFSGGCSSDKNNACPEGIAGPAHTRVMLDTRGKGYPYTEVSIDPQTLESLLKSYNVEEGRVEMEFTTRSDINPNTGGAWDRRDLRPKAAAAAPATPAAAPAADDKYIPPDP